MEVDLGKGQPVQRSPDKAAPQVTDQNESAFPKGVDAKTIEVLAAEAPVVEMVQTGEHDSETTDTALLITEESQEEKAGVILSGVGSIAGLALLMGGGSASAGVQPPSTTVTPNENPALAPDNTTTPSEAPTTPVVTDPPVNTPTPTNLPPTTAGPVPSPSPSPSPSPTDNQSPTDGGSASPTPTSPPDVSNPAPAPAALPDLGLNGSPLNALGGLNELLTAELPPLGQDQPAPGGLPALPVPDAPLPTLDFPAAPQPSPAPPPAGGQPPAAPSVPPLPAPPLDGLPAIPAGQAPILNIADSAKLQSLSLDPQQTEVASINDLSAGSAQINPNNPLNSEVTVLDPEIVVGPRTGSEGAKPAVRIGDIDLLYKTRPANLADELTTGSELSPGTPNAGPEGLESGQQSGQLGSLVRVSELEVNLETSQMDYYSGQLSAGLRQGLNSEGATFSSGMKVDDFQLLGRQSLGQSVSGITAPTNEFVVGTTQATLGDDNPVSAGYLQFANALDSSLNQTPSLGMDLDENGARLGSPDESGMGYSMPTPPTEVRNPLLGQITGPLGEGLAGAVEGGVGGGIPNGIPVAGTPLEMFDRAGGGENGDEPDGLLNRNDIPQGVPDFGTPSVISPLENFDSLVAGSVVTLGTAAFTEIGYGMTAIASTYRYSADFFINVMKNPREENMTAAVFGLLGEVQANPQGDNAFTRNAGNAAGIFDNLTGADFAGYVPAAPESGAPSADPTPEQAFANGMQSALENQDPATGFAAAETFTTQIMDDTVGVAAQLAGGGATSVAQEVVGDFGDDGVDTEFGTFFNGPAEDEFGAAEAFQDQSFVDGDSDALSIADGVLSLPSEGAAALAGQTGGDGAAPSLVNGLAPVDTALATNIVEAGTRVLTGVGDGLELFADTYDAGKSAMFESFADQDPTAAAGFFSGLPESMPGALQAVAQGQETPNNADFAQAALTSIPDVAADALAAGGAPSGGNGLPVDPTTGLPGAPTELPGAPSDLPIPPAGFFETGGSALDSIVSQDPTPISATAGYEEGFFAAQGAGIDSTFA